MRIYLSVRKIQLVNASVDFTLVLLNFYLCQVMMPAMSGCDQVRSKTVRQCVEFYYLWKKVCPDDYKRMRILRRKRDPDNNLYNLRSAKQPTSSTDDAQLSEPSEQQPSIRHHVSSVQMFWGYCVSLLRSVNVEDMLLLIVFSVGAFFRQCATTIVEICWCEILSLYKFKEQFLILHKKLSNFHFHLWKWLKTLNIWTMFSGLSSVEDPWLLETDLYLTSVEGWKHASRRLPTRATLSVVKIYEPPTWIQTQQRSEHVSNQCKQLIIVIIVVFITTSTTVIVIFIFMITYYLLLSSLKR